LFAAIVATATLEMEATLAHRVTLRADVLTRTLEGCAVMLDLSSEDFFGLNAVGSRMLTALLDSHTIGDACDTLLQEYDVPVDRLRGDLLALTEELSRHGLVVLSRP
jgi:hypothetical protein